MPDVAESLAVEYSTLMLVSTGFDNVTVNVAVVVPLLSSLRLTSPIVTVALSSFVIVPTA